MKHKCAECGDNFKNPFNHTRYCSSECKRKRDNRVRRIRHRCPHCGGRIAP